MADFQMNDRQRGLARHALGLPNQRRTSYRNHFVTGPGCTDFEDWMAMVDGGYAKRGKSSPLTGGDEVFFLTRAGALAALNPGESLEARPGFSGRTA